MQLFLRSFFIFVFSISALSSVASAQSAPTNPITCNVTLNTCAQKVRFDWSTTPAGSLATESCSVGLGVGNDGVGNTCAGNNTLNAPVARGVYIFTGMDLFDGAERQSNTVGVCYAPGINCANQCRDGIDNDLTGGIDQADLSCTCPTGSATAGGTIGANPFNNESFVCASPSGGGTTKFICASNAVAGSSCGTCVEGGASPTCASGATTFNDQASCESSPNNVCGSANTPPPAGLKCISNQCQNCGGTTGIACDPSTTCTSVVGASCGATTPRCGDGIVTAPEECDRGGENGTSNCSATCTNVAVQPECGDGVVNGSEQCETNFQCSTGSICSSCSCVVNTPGSVVQDIGFGNPTGSGFNSNLTVFQNTPFTLNWRTTGPSGLTCDNIRRITSGVPTPSFILGTNSLNGTRDLSYAQGTYSFSQTCTVSGVPYLSPTATLTVTATPPATGFECVSNLCRVCTLGTPGCSSSGECSTAGGSCTTPPPPQQYSCISNRCEPCGGRQSACTNTGFGTSPTCDGVCNVPPSIPNAVCAPNPAFNNNASQLSYSPKPALSGQPFSVSFGFINSGTENWIAGSVFRARAGGGTWSGYLDLPSQVAGRSNLTQNPFFSTSLTAPQLTDGEYGITSYRLNYIMTKNNIAFGSACAPEGEAIEVRNPRCNDGIDNDTETGGVVDDGLPDHPADPGCANASDDDERDQVAGVILRISANPQLVRQRGSSTIVYEVSGCGTLDNKNNTVPRPWELTRDGGNPLAYGTGASGPQILPVTDIQNKTTFTLSCLGSARSATISVIKINEI